MTKKPLDEQKIRAIGLSVLQIEAQAILDLGPQINNAFVAACRAMLNCTGRVIVSGMGKSGHIGKKIAATLSSTGTPAFFLHPAEASHGDLGMITPEDLLILLSYSGETEEIIKILPLIKRRNVQVIALTGSRNSSLKQYADIHLYIPIQQEACSLGLAPTASTTAMLAMGDALAMAILDSRGFTIEDFAHSHPGGRLGRRLLLRIEDLMRTDHQIPIVHQTAPLSEAILEISAKQLGFTNVVLNTNPTQLVGIFTDGDLRRTLEKGLDIHQTLIQQVMTTHFTTVLPHTLATEALAIMEKLKILSLPVLDSEKRLIGSLNMHDLFKAGLI